MPQIWRLVNCSVSTEATAGEPGSDRNSKMFSALKIAGESEGQRDDGSAVKSTDGSAVCISSPGDPTLFSDLYEHQAHMWYRYTHAGRTYI